MSANNGNHQLSDGGCNLILNAVKTALYKREVLDDEYLSILYLIQKGDDGKQKIEQIKEYFSQNGLLEDLQELNNVLNALKCQKISSDKEKGTYYHEYIAGIPVVACPFSGDFEINFKAHKFIYANLIEEALSDKIKNKKKDSAIKDVKIDVLNSMIYPNVCKKHILVSEPSTLVYDLSSFEMPDSLVLEKNKLSTFVLPIRIVFEFDTLQEAVLDYGNRFNEIFFDIDFMKAVEDVVISRSNKYMPRNHFDIGCGMPFIISELVESYTAFIKREKMYACLHPHLKKTSPKKYTTEVQLCKEDHRLQINLFIEDVLHHSFEYGPMDIYNHENEPQDLIIVEDALKNMGLDPVVVEVADIDNKSKTFFRPQLSLVV